MFVELVGKTLTEIKRNGDELIFVVNDGTKYKMYHEQECCEWVYIEDINGDLADLIGKPIVIAEEVQNFVPTDPTRLKKSEDSESCSWTFYRLATIKGYVDICWYNESNGCYFKSVDFIQVGVDSE